MSKKIKRIIIAVLAVVIIISCAAVIVNKTRKSGYEASGYTVWTKRKEYGGYVFAKGAPYVYNGQFGFSINRNRKRTVEFGKKTIEAKLYDVARYDGETQRWYKNDDIHAWVSDDYELNFHIAQGKDADFLKVYKGEAPKTEDEFYDIAYEYALEYVDAEYIDKMDRRIETLGSCKFDDREGVMTGVWDGFYTVGQSCTDLDGGTETIDSILSYSVYFEYYESGILTDDKIKVSLDENGNVCIIEVVKTDADWSSVEIDDKRIKEAADSFIEEYALEKFAGAEFTATKSRLWLFKGDVYLVVNIKYDDGYRIWNDDIILR